MNPIKIGLLGLGTVGGGTLKVLQRNQEEIRRRAGRGIEELLLDYPYLEREDILQALRYAAWRMEEREIELAPA